MTPAENSRGAVLLQAAWGAFGRQLAVCIGALVALASLLADAPVSVASLRGAVACGVLIGLTRLGEWLGARTACPQPTGAEGEERGDVTEASR